MKIQFENNKNLQYLNQAPAGGPEGDFWTKLIFSLPIRRLKQII